VALVTGGSRRIGREICLRLARDGAAIAVNARASRAETDEVVDAISAAGGRAVIAMGDITQEDSCRAVIASAVDAFGRLDILVHNAVQREHRRIDALDLDAWRKANAVVLDGAFLASKYAAPHMTRQGGRILLISGASAFVGSSGPATPAAKAGLVGLARSLARALGPQGVTANVISPGRIEDVSDSQDRRAMLAGGRPDDSIPLQRPGTPADVANVVAAMASDDFAYVTGQVLHVTGGFYMG
jgi:3-oxoacyl-[acyl-carrier protein] reductase